MSRAWRWLGVGAAVALVLGVVVHAALLARITGAGAEAVGVALGPGTSMETVLLMLGFLGLRAALFLGGPALVVAAAFALWPARAQNGLSTR